MSVNIGNRGRSDIDVLEDNSDEESSDEVGEAEHGFFGDKYIKKVI